ncbi:toll/interleukin-1 receptor domain-containing protein [Pectobacterium sp. PL64]|uniref:TIR domain-containing protein n=1 Tax=Pectobacterium sp. PL64 TaxID=2738983 RepID=UPI001F0B98E1|nr:TIR domain-containing protein [Pectobacterium sp. PL64]UMO86452.1 toll/interleukin-1 receptor domain-containing protein [Pectobacterium sp. PL64]
MKIFISYTTRDNIITSDFLVELESRISDLGCLYIDLLHNNSEDKQARVENELQQADIFLLLNTASIRVSPWVKWEIDTAKSNNIYNIKINVTPSNSNAVFNEIRLAITNAINQKK